MSPESRPTRAPAARRALAVGIATALAASYPSAARADGEPSPVACRTVFVTTNLQNALGSNLISADVRSALSAVFTKYGLREVSSKSAADMVLTLGSTALSIPARSSNRTYYYPNLIALAELQGRYGGEKQKVVRTYSSGQNKIDHGSAARDALALWPGSSKSFVSTAIAPLFEKALPELANGVRIASEPSRATIEVLKDTPLHSLLVDPATAKTPKVLGCFPVDAQVHVKLTLGDHGPAEVTLRATPAASQTPIRLRRFAPTTLSALNPPNTADASGASSASGAGGSSGTSSASAGGGASPAPIPLDRSAWVLGALVVVFSGAALLVVRARKRASAPEPPLPASPTPGDREGRAALRRLIEHAVKSDADLSAFCFDYFENEVYRDFSDGMERSQKITILMRDVQHREIRRRLAERFPDEVAAFEREERGSP